jgi:RNase H-like domain found in reverse transcriptase
LGMTNFYNKFIPQYSSLAVPLTNLTKKREPDRLNWSQEHDQAFQALKDCLAKDPILVWPNRNEDFHLQTDASGIGIGAVLLQLVDGVKHPVLYASRKLLDRETRYSTIERELLAIVWAVQKFQLYLYGKPFWLETDHQPLVYLNTSQPSNHRLLRWTLILQQYQIRISSIKGKDNHMADFLSRIV